jgi:3-methylfumaryl-CoA hydratase
MATVELTAEDLKRYLGRRPDGSPAETGVVPELPLPRRKFAGERLRFHRPIRVGETLSRETELTDISLKAGGTGALVFATVVNRIAGPEGLTLEEERRTVFREEVPAGQRTQARAPLFDTAPFELRGRPTADGLGAELWAVTPEGTVAMSAQVEFAP